MPKVNLITLGCAKNTVDSERMHRLLELNDYQVTDVMDEAEVIIVNTCGFIQPAKEESISAALEAADYKESGHCKGLIVTGCMAERYREELREELTEADLILGLAAEQEIVSHCDRLLGRSRPATKRDGQDRHLLTPQHWAYLRISDGCDRTCAFCAIPSIKGRNRSESIEVLVSDAVRLVSQGVKEIALVAQDTMRYGSDIYGTPRLADLVRELVQIDGLEWLRLLYAYPTGWREELIDLLATEPKLCAYVDMPIQHASDRILKSMNRGTTQVGIRKLIEKFRDRIPDLTIRSSVIAGFPGEDESDVETLLEFLDDVRLNRLAGFLYSHEEGTTAGLMIDDVPDEEKRDRLDRIMALQTTISAEISETHIGDRLKVLVERPSDEPEFDFMGRTRMDAPEIDGEVFISGPARVGEFVEVEVTDAFEYDLVGRTVNASPLIDIAPPEEAVS